MNFVGLSIVNDLRIQLYAHMQRLSLSFYHKNATGVLISRVTNDVNLIQSSVSDFVTGAVKDSFTFVGLTVVVFSRDWKLALFGLLVVPLAVYPIYAFGRRLRRLAHEGQRVMADLTTVLTETLGGARIVKAFNMEKHEIDRFAVESRRRFSVALKTVAVRAVSSPLMESLGGLCIAGIIWYGGYQVIKGQATPGSFISFMTALLLLYRAHPRPDQAQRRHPAGNGRRGNGCFPCWTWSRTWRTARAPWNSRGSRDAWNTRTCVSPTNRRT